MGVCSLGLAAIAGLIMVLLLVVVLLLLLLLTKLVMVVEEELVTSGRELRIGELLLLLVCFCSTFGLSSTSLLIPLIPAAVGTVDWCSGVLKGPQVLLTVLMGEFLKVRNLLLLVMLPSGVVGVEGAGVVDALFDMLR